MTEVEITDGHLRVVVKGFDKVLALRSTLEVPLAHVRGASQDPDALRDDSLDRLHLRVARDDLGRVAPSGRGAPRVERVGPDDVEQHLGSEQQFR